MNQCQNDSVRFVWTINYNIISHDVLFMSIHYKVARQRPRKKKIQQKFITFKDFFLQSKQCLPDITSV